MELRTHLLVLGVLAVYTAVLVLLVARNVHALRTHHACSDVSTPLARTVASLLDAEGVSPGAVMASVAGARFHAVRVLVFDPRGDVLLDTHDPETRSARPANEAQRLVRAAALGKAEAPTVVHREDGTRLAHVVGVPSDSGLLVVTEALAV